MISVGKLQTTAQILRSGDWDDLWRASRAQLSSESKSYGLRRDLTLPFPAPDAAIPITIRPIAERDMTALFEVGQADHGGEAVRERTIRRRMVESGIGTCYLAVNDQDEPCYMQWLIGPEDNAKVQELFGDRFPPLAKGEMLLEGAFTLEKWRGQKIMAAAMARIAERAAGHDARWVITFVATDNVPSLKGCKRAGFEPYVERTGIWRLFRHRSEFAPLASPPAI